MEVVADRQALPHKLAPQIQKFRGPRAVNNFLETKNPFDGSLDLSALDALGGGGGDKAKGAAAGGDSNTGGRVMMTSAGDEERLADWDPPE